MQAARLFDVREIAFDAGHPLLDQTPVGLDLRLARTAEKAKAATLAFEMGPGAHQARLLIGEMGEFDLQRAFARPRPPPENLENEPGPVDHFGSEGLFEVALLHRRKGAIHDDQIDRLVAHLRSDFFDLALAEKTGWPDLPQRHDLAADELDVDGLGETACLFHPRLRRAAMADAGGGVAALAFGEIGTDDKRPRSLDCPRAPRLGPSNQPRTRPCDRLTVLPAPRRRVRTSESDAPA